MKNAVKISRLSIICVLCAAGFSAAYAAPSVRSLGGAGTYTSASNAAAARSTGSSAINSVRAGSVRATPSVGANAKPVSNTSSGSSVRAASNPRLSVGSYLQGGKTISSGGTIVSQNPGSKPSGGNSGGSSGEIDPGLVADVNDLKTRVGDLETSDSNKYTIPETDDLLDLKQDILIAGDGIDITDGVIKALTADGREIELRNNGTSIQWRYDDPTAPWEDLVLLSDLQGPQGLPGEKGDKGDKGDKGEPGDAGDLTNYVKQDALTQTLLAYVKSTDVPTIAQTAKDNAVAAVLQDIIDNPAKYNLGSLAGLDSVNGTTIAAGSVGPTHLTTGLQAVIGSAVQPEALTGLATKTELTTGLATKANATDLANKADKTELEAKADKSSLGALSGKNSITTADIADTSVTRAKLSTEVQDALDQAGAVDLTPYAKTADVNTGLAGKADKTELANFATSSDLSDGLDLKADKADTYTKAQVDSAVNVKADSSAVTTALNAKADATAVDAALATKADKTQLTGLATTAALGQKADKATTLAGYGITDAMTTTDINTALGKKANTADLGTLAGKSAVATADITDASVTRAKLSTEVQDALDNAGAVDLTPYAKTADVNTQLATKAALTDLDDLATKESLATVETSVANKADATATAAALALKANEADLGTLAKKSAVATTDIADTSVTKAKLAQSVQDSLGKADSALQPGDAPDISSAPTSGDYVLVTQDGTSSWMKIAY